MQQGIAHTVVVHIVSDVVGGGLGSAVALPIATPMRRSEHIRVIAAIAEGHGLLARDAVMRHEPLDAARLAAIGRNQIREIRMPTHPAHIAAQSHQFGLQLGPDKGTDLEVS